MNELNIIYSKGFGNMKKSNHKRHIRPNKIANQERNNIRNYKNPYRTPSNTVPPKKKNTIHHAASKTDVNRCKRSTLKTSKLLIQWLA